MARLIDADKIEIRYENEMYDNDLVLVPLRDVKESIAAAPTVDAVEVVHCKDCNMYGTYERSGNGYCKHYNGLMNPKPTDFCSHGKRRR